MSWQRTTGKIQKIELAKWLGLQTRALSKEDENRHNENFVDRSTPVTIYTSTRECNKAMFL